MNENDFMVFEEAEDAIKAVIVDNSYAPEFVIVKKQVVATLASAYILHLDEIKHNLAKEYNGLLKDFDNNIKDFNNLLSAYNKSQEENQKLKNQLQSQNQKKTKNISR